MSGTTISTADNVGVVLQSKAQLTVTSTGSINPTHVTGTNGRYTSVFAYYPATIINNGLIVNTYGGGAGGPAVYMIGGSLNNSGTITAPVGGKVLADGVLSLFNTKIQNSGLINGGWDGVYTQSGYVLNQAGGQIYGVAGGVFGYNAITVVNDGTIDTGSSPGIILQQGGMITNAGTIAGTHPGGSQVNNAITASGGPTTLVVDAGATFVGGVTVASGLTNNLVLAGSTPNAGIYAGYLSLNGPLNPYKFSGFSNITFQSGISWGLQGTAAELASGQQIFGFGGADHIYLSGFSATSKIYNAGVLTLSNGTSTEKLTFANEPAQVTTADFSTQIIGAGGTFITICYLRGTKILTPQGEVAVEELAIGDYVVTRFGGAQRIKWLGQQRYARRFLEHNRAHMPVKICEGALGRGLPWRDLFVSPGHSMLLGETLVLASSLVNGITITQSEAPEEIHYIQIDLETHDCVLAEGCWSETYADAPGLRAKFHNAAEFWALYPEYITPDELTLCASRPERGPELDAVLLPVVAQAAALVQPGALHGWIDRISPDGLIEGWAWDAANPELPVLLEIWAGAEKLGTVLARDLRLDVAEAGYGNGQSSFSFQGKKVDVATVQIRRAADGAVLRPTNNLWERLGLAAAA